MTLAERIKDARTAKHYTQKDLAELMNGETWKCELD